MTFGESDSLRISAKRFPAVLLQLLFVCMASSIVSAVVVRPPKSLDDPLATDEAKSLISFLVDNYGQKVLSGQQELSEIDYIYSITGKKPAVGVFDLIDYSPSRIEHGADPTGQVESWIDWANTGGIVSLSWHWNAPTDLIDEPDAEWWRGFYTYATTFDIEAVLADPEGERYQLLIRDLDAIAAELDKFQTAGLPILWRPLHEASGGWFWWGAHGPGPFIELWQLMHDRFVNVHGLHHLIWVYTVGDPAWYPGDAYVDIVGRDIYPASSETSMIYEWEETQSRHEEVNLVALSESGILPDPDRIREDEVWWSWFSVWSGSFIHDVDITYLNEVYHDPDIITLDELVDWKNYPINTLPPTCAVTWPYDNIKIREETDITISVDTADADGIISKVEFFNGSMVKLGEDTTDPFTYTMTNTPAGTYLLSARATDDDAIKTVSSRVKLLVGDYSQPEWVRYEAEDAVSDGPSLITYLSGDSGDSMLYDNTGGTGLDFSVTITRADSYPLVVRYMIPSGWGDKPNSVHVNDVQLGTPTFYNTNGVWTDFDFGDVALNAGANTIRIQHDWGWMYVDYIEMFLPGVTSCPEADFDMDCGVDGSDLVILSAGWLNPYTMIDMANLADDWLN